MSSWDLFHAEKECFNLQCKKCLWLDYNLYSVVPVETLVVNMAVLKRFDGYRNKFNREELMKVHFSIIVLTLKQLKAQGKLIIAFKYTEECFPYESA